MMMMLLRQHVGDLLLAAAFRSRISFRSIWCTASCCWQLPGFELLKCLISGCACAFVVPEHFSGCALRQVSSVHGATTVLKGGSFDEPHIGRANRVAEPACLLIEYKARKVAQSGFLEYLGVAEDVGVRVGGVVGRPLEPAPNQVPG